MDYSMDWREKLQKNPRNNDSKKPWLPVNFHNKTNPLNYGTLR
jgi:hypothetical protein